MIHNQTATTSLKPVATLVLSAFFTLGQGPTLAQSTVPGTGGPAPERKPDPSPKAPVKHDDTTDPVMLLQVLEPAEVRAKLGDDSQVKHMAWAKSIRYFLPFKWIPQKPENPMRIGQAVINPLANTALGTGLLTVSADIGGGVEGNVARWVSQFSNLDGVPTQQDLMILDTGLVATQVFVVGTYDPQMPGADNEPKPDTALFGAIVQGGPEGDVYFKAVGPRQVMEERRPAWDMMIRTLRVLPKPNAQKLRQGEPAPADERNQPGPPSPPTAPATSPAPASKEP